MRRMAESLVKATLVDADMPRLPGCTVSYALGAAEVVAGTGTALIAAGTGRGSSGCMACGGMVVAGA